MASNNYIRYECNFHMDKPQFHEACMKAGKMRNPVCISTVGNFISNLMDVDKKTVVVSECSDLIYVQTFENNSTTIIMTRTGWILFSYAFKRLDDLYDGVVGEGAMT